MTVTDRSPSDAASLVAPLFAGLALLAAVHHPGAWWGWAAVGVLATLAVVLVWAAVPRVRRFAVAPTAVLALDPSDEGEETFYRVFLEQHGRRALLLEHDDLGVVISDVQRITAETGVAASVAWNLPAECFERTRRGRHLGYHPTTVVGPPAPAQLAVARACFGAGAFVLLVLAWTVLHAHAVSLLSVVLPLASVAFVLFVGASTQAKRTEVVLTTERIRVHRVTLGHRSCLFEIPSDELISAAAVAHGDRSPRHFLFVTTRGVRTVPLGGNAARDLAARFFNRPSDTSALDTPPASSHRDAPRRPYSVRPSAPAPASRKHPC